MYNKEKKALSVNGVGKKRFPISKLEDISIDLLLSNINKRLVKNKIILQIFYLMPHIIIKQALLLVHTDQFLLN